MFLQEPPSPEKQEKTLREITVERESMERESQALFQKLDLSPEELHTFLQEPAHFTPTQWAFIQESQSQLEEKLSPSAPPTPAQTRRALREVAKAGWIPCR